MVRAKKRGDTRLYASYLHKEKASKYFNIGGYHIIATKSRVTIEKNLHKSLVTFKINDIESVEYTTEVKWMSAIRAFFWLAFAYVFYFQLGTAKISFWSFFFNLEGLIYVIRLLALLFFVLGLIALHSFVTSFTGRLKIRLRYTSSPVEIYSNFNRQIPELISYIEAKRQ